MEVLSRCRAGAQHSMTEGNHVTHGLHGVLGLAGGSHSMVVVLLLALLVDGVEDLVLQHVGEARAGEQVRPAGQQAWGAMVKLTLSICE